MCELALTKAQSEKRKVKSAKWKAQSEKWKRKAKARFNAPRRLYSRQCGQDLPLSHPYKCKIMHRRACPLFASGRYLRFIFFSFSPSSASLNVSERCRLFSCPAAQIPLQLGLVVERLQGYFVLPRTVVEVYGHITETNVCALIISIISVAFLVTIKVRICEHDVYGSSKILRL